MVKNAPEISEVLRDFQEWMGDSILVAHNASFDMGFLTYGTAKNRIRKKQTNGVIDTLELGRFLYPAYEKPSFKYSCEKV